MTAYLPAALKIHSYEDAMSAIWQGISLCLEDDILVATARQGAILLLPRLNKIREINEKRTGVSGNHSVICRGFKVPPNDGAFGHPIMVLSRKAATPDLIDFVMMTSFNGQTLQEKHGRQPFRYSDYIPISPTLAHPFTQNGSDPRYETLAYDNPNMELLKHSYLALQDIYTMSLHDAEGFWVRKRSKRLPHMLSPASCRQVLDLLRARPGQYLPGDQHLVTSQGLWWIVLMSPVGIILSICVALLCALAKWFFG
ncbi:hypothetical protein LTR27_006775 [Elasticomyces elasticus]|nr:hypothetical protein LTR27_006775 [Elasticomyces elasticus]